MVSNDVIDYWDVYDIYGKLVHHSSTGNDRQVTLDISAWATGIYYARINGTTTARFARQ